jgi:D-alanyl-D-alanine carboxypeptidase/D-alanyl-D-alanine-endopeptidase (penicillin-binding protein 4)
MKSGAFRCCLALLASVALQGAAGIAHAQKNDGAGVSKDIKKVMDQPAYKGATWGLRVIDLESGRELVNLNPGRQFLIASVRKNFSVGELMDQVGPGYRYNTPVYREGKVNSHGVLDGNLVLVASGDLTMGGRTNPDGTVAYTIFDHNEANALGNAVLSKPDPLAGYKALARQVAASGIKEIKGDVVIDDRLFKPYEFREEFEIRPIFVNDDLVDLIINPEPEGDLASLRHRPVSKALTVKNEVEMTGSNTEASIKPELPTCIGERGGCSVTLQGNLPVGYKAPLTGAYPLIRTYRITKPSAYARTIFIEELRAAGVTVKARAVGPNPEKLLPPKDCYDAKARVAELEGMPYSEDAKLVMKVSYNLGADTSLLLWGLTAGVNNMAAALDVEKRNLSENFGIPQSEYNFVDGSGDGDSTATNEVVTHFLSEMSKRSYFPDYLASFPILGVDGSLGTVTDFEENKTLAPAKGKVFAKTGTYLGLGSTGLELKAQAFGGYITTKCGKKLAYQLVVNGVPIANPEDPIPEIVNVFQDEGRISAILWRDF